MQFMCIKSNILKLQWFLAIQHVFANFTFYNPFSHAAENDIFIDKGQMAGGRIHEMDKIYVKTC